MANTKGTQTVEIIDPIDFTEKELGGKMGGLHLLGRGSTFLVALRSCLFCHPYILLGNGIWAFFFLLSLFFGISFCGSWFRVFVMKVVFPHFSISFVSFTIQ